MRMIPLIPDAGNLHHMSRIVCNVFMMVGASYIPWVAGTLTEFPGEGYQLSLMRGH